MEKFRNFFKKKEKSELVELLAECSRSNFDFWLTIASIENRKIEAAMKALKAELRKDKKKHESTR